jgi:hypothetical protein
MKDAPGFHLVLTEDTLVLVKAPDADWRAMQARYPSYKTSNGPWPLSDIMAFMQYEWPNLMIERGVDIIAWAASSEEELVL